MGDLSIHWEIAEVISETMPSPQAAQAPYAEGRRRQEPEAIHQQLADFLAAASGSEAVEGRDDTTAGGPITAEDLSRGEHPAPPPLASSSQHPPCYQRDPGLTWKRAYYAVRGEGGGDRVNDSGDGRRPGDPVAKIGPFSIAPGSTVVPAGDEVSFELAFSPTFLGCTE